MLNVATSTLNEIEIAVIGVQRSGNHAIQNWMLSLFSGNVAFYNSFHQAVTNEPWNFSHFHDFQTQMPALRHRQRLRAGKPRQLVMYSIENQSLDSIIANLDRTNRHQWFGASKSFRFVLILRDPFNTFASRLKDDMEKDYPGRTSLLRPSGQRFIDNWKSYARESLGITHQLCPADVTTVLYNRWVTDPLYRQSICKELGGEYNDSQINVIPKIGGGSSFDGVNFQGRAGEMDLFNRWRSLCNHPQYIRIFKDNELFELSERLFGPIEGTEILRTI